MKKIKLLAIDMDGTMLKDDKTIDKADLKAVVEALDSGIEVVIASGRPLEYLPEPMLKLDIHYAIILNGAGVVDLNTNQLMYHRTMNNQQAIALLEALEGMDVYVGLQSGAKFYYGGRGLKDVMIQHPRLNNRRGIYVRDLNKLLEDENFQVEKMSIHTLKENESKILQLQGEFLDLNIMDSADGVLEVNDRMNSKGAALKWLCRKLDIDRQYVAAIGDSDNDLTMLSFAGYSFAMGNSSQFVQNICDETVTTNMENGVRKAIKKIMELGSSLYPHKTQKRKTDKRFLFSVLKAGIR
ncbi:MAG: Cof-type HAD-IIB family hydrolase [Erysipelotrichaceae bacterium]|nr:Cof-type HAD-IIB family hydrolase [Erysipelotrichaceae bacterium]